MCSFVVQCCRGRGREPLGAMGVRMLGGLLHWVRAALTAAVGLAGLGGTSPAPQERRRSRATVELDRQHRADPATVAGKTPVRYLEDLDEQQAAARQSPSASTECPTRSTFPPSTPPRSARTSRGGSAMPAEPPAGPPHAAAGGNPPFVPSCVGEWVGVPRQPAESLIVRFPAASPHHASGPASPPPGRGSCPRAGCPALPGTAGSVPSA